MEEDNNLELGNPESFGGTKDQDYSRSMLLMKATCKVIEAGSREMKRGFFVEKRDKFGNLIRSLTDDTRKAYCEAVETLKNLQSCDFDTDIKTKVKNIYLIIDNKYKELILEEYNEFNRLTVLQKETMFKKGLGHTIGALNTEKIFYERYIIFELKKHRELFEVLTQHSKNQDHYSKETTKG